MLGDLGGVTEVLAIGFGFVLLPLAEHLFVLEATKQIFMVKTRDETLFEHSKKQKGRAQRATKLKGTQDLETHRYIKMRLRDKLLLYLKKTLGCNCVSRIWRNGRKYEMVFELGRDRIDSELNIIKFMNNLRNIKILLKASLMKDPEIRMQVKHDDKNLILVDDRDVKNKKRTSHLQAIIDTYAFAKPVRDTTQREPPDLQRPTTEGDDCNHTVLSGDSPYREYQTSQTEMTMMNPISKSLSTMLR